MTIAEDQIKPWLAAALCLLLGSAAGWTAWRSLRIALASQAFAAGNLPGAREALRYEPANGRYWLGLALLLDLAGMDPEAALRSAVQRMPTDAGARIRLGLWAEAAGRLDEAEKHLLQAAKLSRKFEPRWALANFYFRHNSEDFWLWTLKALEMSYGDRTPVFELCFAREPNAQNCLQRLTPSLQTLPRTVRADLARFLSQKSEWDAASGLWLQLAREALPGEGNGLMTAIDDMIRNGRWEVAAQIWNQLSMKGLVSYAQVPAKSGSAVVNGDFARWSSQHGFDWRIPLNRGVWVTQKPYPAGWEISLDGSQSDGVWILWQPVLLQGSGRYTISVDYRCSNSTAIVASRGLEMLVLPPTSDSVPMAVAGLPCDESRAGTAFTVPDGRPGIRVVLSYRRPPGAIRWEGRVQLRRIEVVRSP